MAVTERLLTERSFVAAVWAYETSPGSEFFTSLQHSSVTGVSETKPGGERVFVGSKS
jgi:hypothetical protein